MKKYKINQAKELWQKEQPAIISFVITILIFTTAIAIATIKIQ